jgi:Spy/CpxP family protein refolding chaperone
MRSLMVALLAALALWSGISSAEAVGPYLELREELGLSEEQVTKLESIASAFKKRQIAAKADLDIAELELDELLRADQVDLEKAKAKLREIAGLQVDLRLLRIQQREHAKKVLNPEQVAKLGAIKRSRRPIPEGDKWPSEEFQRRMRGWQKQHAEAIDRIQGELQGRMREMEKRYKEDMAQARRDLEANLKALEGRLEGMLREFRSRD